MGKINTVGQINTLQYTSTPMSFMVDDNHVKQEQFKDFQKNTRKQFENCEYLVTRYAEQIASNNKDITEYCNTIADYVADEMGHYLILNTYFQNEMILLKRDIAILEAKEKAINDLNWFQKLFKSKREAAINKAQAEIEAQYQPLIDSTLANSQEIKAEVLNNLKK